MGATTVGVRLPPADLARLDAWIAQQPDPKPGRATALRDLALNALAPREEPDGVAQAALLSYLRASLEKVLQMLDEVTPGRK